MKRAMMLGTLAALAALPAGAQETELDRPMQSPRTGGFQIRLGGYKPRIDEESGLSRRPYERIFGDESMLLVEGELQRYFYQGIGTAGVGLSVGYAEKYGNSLLADGTPAAEKTALKVLPIQVNGFYKFDYAAFEWGIPLVPYGKLGLIYTPWWSNKGDETESANGRKASGGKWGYGLTGGISFMLDFLEPRFARDFDTDLGVNHSYLFAEYTYSEVNNFGGEGFNLGSRSWMFGLALDY